MISIKNLTIVVDQKQVVKNLSVTIDSGKIHLIMGQNGSGKSSLAHAIMGLPAYQIIHGDMSWHGQSFSDIPMHQRSRMGIFLAFQQPVSIPGVTVFQFLKEMYAAAGKVIGPVEFQALVEQLCTTVGLDYAFLYRGLHENFSGGEKKRLEIVQMLLLEPKLIMLDEIDSGLDIDALRMIGHAVYNYLKTQQDASCIIITHYRRIIDYLTPDVVHVMHNGTIVQSGDGRLVSDIEARGYAQYE